MTDKLTLKLNDQIVEITMDDNGRYSLNDLFRASGESRSKAPVQFLRWKQSGVEVVNLNDVNPHRLPEDFDSYVIVAGKGRGSKTFAPLKVVYKYAAFISKDFENAVYDAFTKLTTGDVTEAANIASAVTLTPEIINQCDKACDKLRQVIQTKVTDNKYMYNNLFRIIGKASTGYTPKELTNGVSTAKDWIVKENHLPAMNAYLACVRICTTLIVAGVTDYHVLAAAIGAETGKNKDILMEALG